jgi:hypothetical protein
MYISHALIWTNNALGYVLGEKKTPLATLASPKLIGRHAEIALAHRKTCMNILSFEIKQK